MSATPGFDLCMALFFGALVVGVCMWIGYSTLEDEK